MFIADFHIHSKYSRATSKDCVPEILEFWARRKGIDVIGTGDFTHPAWREELKEKFVPTGDGLYVLKDQFRKDDKIAGPGFKPQFIVSGEISSIYKKNGRVRKVHNVVLLPSLEHAELISHKLEAIGNLHSDGRPILGLDSRDLLEIVLDICQDAIFIPAHIWTPHFSLYGAYSGFDDITECFEDLTGYIYALETGLSSDPPMNWRLSSLDNFTMVSNSDAHSPKNLAREASIFDTDMSYQCMLKALKNRSTKEFYGTIEFFPEEGKYHYDGHRACNVCCKPSDTKAAGGICPVCGGRITVGVLHRVEALADREEGFVPAGAKHFESIVPLYEVIASSIGYTVTSAKVKNQYDDMIKSLGTELYILREAPLKDIESASGVCIAEGIRRLRAGKVEVQPGFDGEYGKIKIIDKSEIDMLSGQLCFIEDINTYIKKAPLPKSIEDIKILDSEGEVATALDDTFPPEDGEDEVEIVSPDILYGLNEEQWKAVSSSEPAIAVIAGPGTGKTKTLVSRISYLVEKCGVLPSQITAVTFTNKAAKEMRLRLEKQFESKRIAGAMTIGTFHSICLQVLSRERGRNSINIIDEYNALSIIEEIIKDMKLKISPREALREISLLKNGTSGEGDNKKSDIDALYDLYRSQLKGYGVMDYDDILLEVLQEFENRNTEDILDKGLESSFSYLLVDEFQDINEIQYRLIKEWGRKCKNIFIIGDPDQSIYGFRGSDFRYFERFKNDFPDIRQVRLTKNYRSTPEIVASAKSVIAKKAEGADDRSLDAKRESGSKIRLIEARDGFSEALFITKEINRIIGGIDMIDAHAILAHHGKRNAEKHIKGFSDIAVLYRTNRQAEILEQCFIKEGIQYVVVGRDEFLSEKPVREAITFFKFLLNPEDMASLLLYLKAENIYSEDFNRKLMEDYALSEKSIASLIRVMEGVQLPLYKQGQPVNFIEMLKKYQSVISKEKPYKIIESWISDNSLSGVKSMEMLLNTAIMHSEMSSFIQNLVLGRESDIVRSGSKVYSQDAVSLMTIHGSKGLEFPIVFITGVNDGMIPLRNISHGFDTEEERRLFYVAMTRARDELILLTSSKPSPFIADISEEQLIRENAFEQKQVLEYKQVSLFD
ncbi:ATP-dependent DNA helicase PcrA [Oxobacter pfennigii]|uniref:DNA 3'-5' helicase n=1 Tax=Oxobacter pfennigii TaxID=36849 RepID=A0A0P8X5M4_9CLOT|nr:UvrD-helicase domain-containing protein [Oxobacter pfennigii]KPU46157.1 ATP-dependent DNA helicase PcrA [Oxobacter pfennigii]